MQYNDLRQQTRAIEANLENAQDALRAQTSARKITRTRIVIPEKYLPLEDQVLTLARKACMYVDAYITADMFASLKRPHIDPTNPRKRYASSKAQADARIAELINYYKKEDPRLRKLIGAGDGLWFRQLVRAFLNLWHTTTHLLKLVLHSRPQ